ncbi:MAG: CBS domain-containing protein [Candidatus Binataceae bacterium]
MHIEEGPAWNGSSGIRLAPNHWISTARFCRARLGGSMMHVREIMTTAVECCTPKDTSQAAAEIMKNADTGVVPIISGENDPRVVGIVTDRDLCLGVIASGRDPRQVHIQDCMTNKVVSCHSEDDVKQAAHTMAENQIRRLPVIDGKGEIIGIVSLGDIAESDSQLNDSKTLRDISQPTSQASKPRAQSKNRH